ncbi:MAG: CDP-alcohol phosphatidyltransferase family protein [Gammaproteobacteria bacterium]|nr:CDP-alcohol phosphatidyltransferase family protein [Gammaproteobacteria bacterium]
MKKSDIPNLISFVRVLLIVPVVWFLLHNQYQYALALFIVAGLSDALDGYLARKYQWGSALGGWLDPLADKAMQVSAYFALTWVGLIPVWLLSAVILRDVLIVCGGLYYYFQIEKMRAAPSWISKLNTLVQILLVVFILIDKSILAVPPAWLNAMIYTVLFTTVLSGLGYVLTWGVKAWRLKRDA